MTSVVHANQCQDSLRLQATSVPSVELAINVQRCARKNNVERCACKPMSRSLALKSNVELSDELAGNAQRCLCRQHRSMHLQQRQVVYSSCKQSHAMHLQIALANHAKRCSQRKTAGKGEFFRKKILEFQEIQAENQRIERAEAESRRLYKLQVGNVTRSLASSSKKPTRMKRGYCGSLERL